MSKQVAFYMNMERCTGCSRCIEICLPGTISLQYFEAPPLSCEASRV